MSQSRCKLCACHAAIAYKPSDLGTRESRINDAGSCRPLARVGHAPASHMSVAARIVELDNACHRLRRKIWMSVKATVSTLAVSVPIQ